MAIILNIMMINRSSEQQILKLFQSLFSRDQLRKNLYLYQHLQSDMTLKTKAIFNERKVAAISKDQSFILQCLKKCPLVQVLNDQTLYLRAGGDALLVYVEGIKLASSSQIKKIVNPLLKDIKNDLRQSQGAVEIQFQSETSVTEFLERLKSKGASLTWKLKQKDPYQCIKKSVKFLLKQRKTQQQSNYVPHQPYYLPQNYYSNQYTPYQNNYNYNQNNHGSNNYQPQYQTFIRKAVDSDEESIIDKRSESNRDIGHEQKMKEKQLDQIQKVEGNRDRNTKSKIESRKENQTQSKFDAEDFPQL